MIEYSCEAAGFDDGFCSRFFIPLRARRRTPTIGEDFMKKRLLILLFLLTAAFLLVTFTACGEDETTPPAGSSDNASPAESSDNTPSSDPAESTKAPVSTDSPVIEAPVCTKHTPSESGRYCTTCYAILKENEKDYKDMIYFYSDNLTLNKAYTVAIVHIKHSIQ